MNILVYDPDRAPNRRPWTDYFNFNDVITEKDRLSADRDTEIVFAHGSYLDEDTIRGFRDSYPKLPLIVVSGGPPPRWWHDDVLKYWRKSPVAKSGNEFAKPCQAFISKFQIDGVLDYDLLDPGHEAELAFRLLCEAWKIKNIDGRTDCKGIPIIAPSGLTDWLAPFSPRGKGDAENIASVVSTMGDADTKCKVEKVLNAVNGDPKEHVLALLGIEEQASKQTERGAQ